MRTKGEGRARREIRERRGKTADVIEQRLLRAGENLLSEDEKEIRSEQETGKDATDL